VGTDSDRVVSSLLFRLEQKKQEQWEETVNSIDFSHSNCKAWNTLNKLAGRSGRSSRVCPLSTKSIASQLMKNGAHKNGGREDNFFRNNINLLKRFANAEKKLCIHNTLNEILISIGKF